MKKFYLTTPIYYVNDKPHIGHAYTTLAADVLARYYRQKHDKVLFLTGLDEHGSKIAQAAEKQNQKPQEFCNKIAREFQKAWQNLNISNDDFIRTTEKQHEQSVKEFLLKIKPYIYKAKYSGLYCTGCEKFLTEKELVDGKCPDHKKAPENISEENYFFKLKKFLPEIKNLIQDNKLKIEPQERKNEALNLFQELEDFSISREKVDWGIKLPWDEKQTCYVWVDALLNYWTARKDFWPPDLHIIGKDILKFHAIYWPALLLAANLELPKKIFIHGYFTINKQKMSKTLGNIIDPNDLIKKFGVDATRYLLLSQFPFGQDGDISLEKLEQTYNSDLVNGLGNLVNRIIKFKLQVTSPKKQTKNNFIENLQFYKALQDVQKKIAQVNNFIDKKAPWQAKNPEPIIKKAWQDIFEIACLLKPFMPETSEKILKQEKVFFKKI